MYLTCVAVYHAMDRMAYPERPGSLVEEWRNASRDFYFVDIIAHHFKHVRADAENVNPKIKGIPIGHALGFKRVLRLETRNLYFVIRDAIKFLHELCGAEIRT